jgi:hypothetical protein
MVQRGSQLTLAANGTNFWLKNDQPVALYPMGASFQSFDGVLFGCFFWSMNCELIN